MEIIVIKNGIEILKLFINDQALKMFFYQSRHDLFRKQLKSSNHRKNLIHIFAQVKQLLAF